MRTFDEMYQNSPAEGGAVRDHYRDYAQWLGKQSQDYLHARSAEAEIVFRRVGITFGSVNVLSKLGSKSTVSLYRSSIIASPNLFRRASV